jgi:hypothetical protein
MGCPNAILLASQLIELTTLAKISRPQLCQRMLDPEDNGWSSGDVTVDR